MGSRFQLYTFMLAGMALLTFSGCGAGGLGGTPPSTTTYTIGGTGLVLQDNGGNNLLVSANGAFVFTTPVASGSTYAVTVLTQPSSPAQSCVVTNGSGTATADVTSVQVACTTTATGHNEWTWESGSSTLNQAGVYGTQGVPSPINTPGARVSPCSWTDLAGNFWLFGGYATEIYVGQGERNDLWKFTPAISEWTWVGGSNTFEQPGIYGTRGTPDPGNVPGGREQAACWTDLSGNFWLFGGTGRDSTGTRGNLNDLWRYAGGEWTWMNGSNLAAEPGLAGAWQGAGIYGTKGVADPANFPGARMWASSWTDLSGNLGSSAGVALTRRGRRGFSTICGSTARASGHGWGDRTSPIKISSSNLGFTGPWGYRVFLTPLALALGPPLGQMRMAISGFSGGMAKMRMVVAGIRRLLVN